MYEVKLEQFNGPFELLTELIDKKKLSINEVSLAEIADQYIEYVKTIENFPTREVASFIVVATTLMLIKSRSLMPSLKLTGEEDLEIENLEEQLKLYKQFNTLARELEKIFGKKIIFGRDAYLNTRTVFIEPRDLSISSLEIAMEEIIKNLPKPEKKDELPETIVTKTISLEQKIESLISRVEEKMKLCFSETHDPNRVCKRMDLVISFLALLELTKRGFIIVRQGKNFGEIEIEKNQNEQIV
ncbi:MAG: segregation/condensation protein A [Patescibacteria group bacterium]